MNKKIRKFISKSLIVGVLFLNIPINTLAETLSLDTRYETFEGNSISIDNILEDNKIDVEIEGNTLVNIHPKYTPYLDTSSNNDGYTVESRENYIKVVGDNSTLDWLYVHFGNLNINMFKPNTTYTIVFSKLKGIDYIALQTSASTNQITNHIEAVNGKLVYTFNTNNQIIDEGQVLYLGVQNTSVDLEVENPMIIEGDWSASPPKGYFEGMYSVGQNDTGSHNIKIFNNNKNLFDNTVGVYRAKNSFNGDNGTITTKKRLELDDEGYYVGVDEGWTEVLVTDNFNVIPNEKYYIYAINKYGNRTYVRGIFLYDDEDNLVKRYWDSTSIEARYIKIPSNATQMKFQISCQNTATNNHAVKIFVGIGELPNNIKCQDYWKTDQDWLISNGYCDYTYESNKNIIQIKEPLRRISDGVMDRIVKIDGKWFVERNCGKMVLTDITLPNSVPFLEVNRAEGYTVFPLYFSDLDLPESINNNTKILCNNFIFKENGYTSKSKGTWVCTNVSIYLIFSLPNTALKTLDRVGFSEWLKENPVEIIYPLTEPIYEPLNIKPILNTYLDTTHIFNNSIIPANMKTIVDRTSNIASKYIQIAKTNPTVENIALARMWIGLLKESTLKDQFNEEVNNIIEIEDMEIEKKKASANLDLYIKTKNTLSLSLDTNSVTFDNYSGVEDIELLNAVNLTVNSSLPYSLNAYMEEGFYNSDKTNSLEVNSLNIRENTDTTYKQFTNIKEKLILKDNCDEGNAKYHTIDLKLNGNNAHKIDVFKTVIKFEIEQK